MKIRQQLLVFLILISISSFSQVASHILFHPNTINAAYAGNDTSLHLGVNYRFQGGGVEGSPRNLFFNMHTPVYKGVGVGLSYNIDKVGPVVATTTSIDISYKYQFDKKNQLSIGVKGINYITSLNYFNPLNSDVDGSREVKGTSYDIGLFYQTAHFFVGLATMNLFSNNTSILGTAINSTTYIANSGFLVGISENMILKPSLTVFMRESYFYYVIATQLNVQTLEASLYYSDGELLGVGIMSPEIFNVLKIGVNYEYQLTNLTDYSSSSFYSLIAKFEIKGLNKSSKTKPASD